MQKPMSQFLNLGLFTMITREQLQTVLDKAYTEFGSVSYLSTDVVAWVKETYNIDISSRSVGRHLRALDIKPTGTINNRHIYTLGKTNL